MLRDQQQAYYTGNADLSAEKGQSVKVVLLFIGRNVAGFRSYYVASDTPQKENPITFYLAQYFNSMLLNESSGAVPYLFYTHPSSDNSESEPDLGAVVSNPMKPEQPFFVIEAKRLSSEISSSHQYVYGQGRGGIERFKKLQHGEALDTSAIIGFVQSDNCGYWHAKINGWVNNQITKNTDSSISWDNQDLLTVLTSPDSALFAHSNSQRQNDTRIILHHYLIDLVLTD